MQRYHRRGSVHALYIADVEFHHTCKTTRQNSAAGIVPQSHLRAHLNMLAIV